jgi:hypothetical protein
VIELKIEFDLRDLRCQLKVMKWYFVRIQFGDGGQRGQEQCLSLNLSLRLMETNAAPAEINVASNSKETKVIQRVMTETEIGNKIQIESEVR